MSKMKQGLGAILCLSGFLGLGVGTYNYVASEVLNPLPSRPLSQFESYGNSEIMNEDRQWVEGPGRIATERFFYWGLGCSLSVASMFAGALVLARENERDE